MSFKQPEEDTLSGKTSYTRNMYCSKHVSQSVSEEIPYLNHNIYGIVVQPLEMCLEEPDNKKKEIIERAKKSGCSVEVHMGNNYYDSCLWVAQMGVEGYYPKKD